MGSVFVRTWKIPQSRQGAVHIVAVKHDQHDSDVVLGPLLDGCCGHLVGEARELGLARGLI